MHGKNRFGLNGSEVNLRILSGNETFVLSKFCMVDMHSDDVVRTEFK